MLIKGEKKKPKTPKIHFSSTCPQKKCNYWLWPHWFLHSYFSVWMLLSAIFWPFGPYVCVCIIYNIYIYYIHIYTCSFLSPILALVKGTQTLLSDKVQWVFASFHGLFPFIHGFTCPDFFCQLPRVWLIYFCLVWLLVFSCSLICEPVMEKDTNQVPWFPSIQKLSELHPGHYFSYTSLKYREGCHWVSQSFAALCDLMDYSLPGSTVHEVFQARYWRRLPFSSPRNLPDPGIEWTLISCLAGRFFTTEPLGKPVK